MSVKHLPAPPRYREQSTGHMDGSRCPSWMMVPCRWASLTVGLLGPQTSLFTELLMSSPLVVFFPLPSVLGIKCEAVHLSLQDI